MSEKPSVVFLFDDQNYERSQFVELKNQLDKSANVQIHEKILRAMVPPAIVTILILVPLYCFSKGFFTKLGEKIGEKLGEAIGEDTVEAYEFLKKKSVEVIQKTKSGQTPMVEFKFMINNTEVSGFIKTSEPSVLFRAFDTIEELFRMSQKHIRDEKLDLKTFVFNLNVDKMVWQPTYYITVKNDLCKFDA